MLIEEGIGEPPAESHYRLRQSGTGPEHRAAAELAMKRNGCTKVVHYAQEPILTSLGFVERLEVVAQRNRQPRHD